MTDKELRVAMIGGHGHNSIVGAFGKAAKLVAIASDGLDEDSKYIQNQSYAAGVPYFDHFERMLDEVKPEAVSIGSWPAKNARLIIAALSRGIHVVSDKPIANSAAELREMRRLAAKHPQVHLLTEFTMRMEAAYQAARQAVRNGKIGQVALVTAQKSYRFGEARPDFYKTQEGFPGTIMFIGCHVIDLAWWITGLKYTAYPGGMVGNISRKDYGQFEDHAVIMLKMEQEACAVMHLDYLRPAAAPSHGDDRIRIAGSNGVVEVRDGRCELITQDQAPTELTLDGYDTAMGVELVNTIRGKGHGFFSTAESLYMAEVILKARDSVDKGRTTLPVKGA